MAALPKTRSAPRLVAATGSENEEIEQITEGGAYTIHDANGDRDPRTTQQLDASSPPASAAPYLSI